MNPDEIFGDKKMRGLEAARVAGWGVGNFNEKFPFGPLSTPPPNIESQLQHDEHAFSHFPTRSLWTDRRTDQRMDRRTDRQSLL